MSDVAILGAGAFGTALAISLAGAGQRVSLWARDGAHVTQMQADRENIARLPGFALPAYVSLTQDLAPITAPIVVITVPMQALRGFLAENAAYLSQKTLIAACKGIDLATGAGPIALIQSACPDAHAAMLSGPSFAADIAAGLPTALTLAAGDDATAAALQDALSTDNLRIYRSTDRIGVELGGALKNVIALAAGMSMGAGLGESARAALMTRGYAEMLRFATAQGAQPATLAGLSGLGDLVLTCTSQKSRNYSHGLMLGAGQPPQKATVEGVATARAVTDIAKTRGIDMPIAAAVAAVLAQELTIPEAMKALLSRPLKKE